jgi:hypothetical protein
MMDGRLPILAKIVAIFPIEIINMFFNFKGFSNYTSGIKGGRRKNFGLVKENKVFRVMRVFINSLFGCMVVENVIYMFFQMGFENSTGLANVGFSTRG